MAGQLLGLVWTFAAIFFIASVAFAPFVALILKAKARSKRLFCDEPRARVDALRYNHIADHTKDAL